MIEFCDPPQILYLRCMPTCPFGVSLLEAIFS